MWAPELNVCIVHSNTKTTENNKEKGLNKSSKFK